jgi:hypothetical protein
MRSARRLASSVIAAALVWAATLVPSSFASEDHSGHGAGTPKRVGVLLMDHGEPPVYNADTYWSFRAFIDHLMQMEVIPSWLRTLDLGTVLQDTACYACPEPRTGARTIDAWLRPHSGAAVFVPQTSDSLPPHYVLPGGPGFGEPDIFEHAGLQVWDEWRRIGGRSPNYDEKLGKKRALIERLKKAYGADLPIRVGYGIDPRIGGAHQGIKQAVEALVNRDRVDGIVAVYHGVGFSDIMQTHMLRHEVHDTLADLGSDVPVRFARPLGSSGHYTLAIVEKVKRELAALPPDVPVAVHLSGHGLPTTTCGGYDCGNDAYHAFAKKLYDKTSRAVRAAIDRPGRTGVFSIFADGSEGDTDPEDRVDSPLEALAKRKREGFRYVIDVPYEFDSNSRDTLIVLREAYGRHAPDWNSRYESRFTMNGLRVKIANASGGDAHKIAAFEAVARQALSGWTTAKTAPDGGHGSHGSHGSTARTAATAATAHHQRAADDHAGSAPAVEPHAAGAPHATVAPTDEHAADVMRPASDAHALPGSSGPTSGAPIVVFGLVALAATGGGFAAGRSTAPMRSRIVLGAVALQLAGFAWDGWLHHRSGHPLTWLENGGHVTVLVGLALAGLAAIDMVRSARD